MAGATIPLTPAVHQMIDVGPIPSSKPTGNEIGFPIVRDMDTFCTSARRRRLEVGSYAHRPIFHDPDDIPSIKESALSPTELPFTPDDFDQQLEEALELMPDILATAEMKYAINGLLSLTPDGFPLLGETAEVQPLVGGRGVDQGRPGRRPHDRGVDDARRARDRPAPLRHHPLLRRTSAPRDHVRARARGALQQDVRHRAPARAVGVGAQPPLRAVPRAQARRSARCTSRRRLGTPALVRVATRRSSTTTASRAAATEWDARWWSPIMNAEHLAMRERVGMIDLAPFAIFDVSGPGRARLPAAPHGQQLRRRGRALRVHAVARRPAAASAPTSRSCASPTTRSAWSPALRRAARRALVPRHLPADGSVTFVDNTSAFRTIGVWGPRARDILGVAHRRRHLRRRLPYGTPDDVDRLDHGPASRISYVGEHGWEVYVPSDKARAIWDRSGRPASRSA